MPEGFDSNPRPSPVAAQAIAPPTCQTLLRPGEDPLAAGSTLTLFQANLLVALLGGFWGRKADGHPGPDLLGRGLVELALLVRWERLKAQRPRSQRQRQGKDPPPSSGLRSRATPPLQIPTSTASTTASRIEL